MIESAIEMVGEGTGASTAVGAATVTSTTDMAVVTVTPHATGIDGGEAPSAAAGTATQQPCCTQPHAHIHAARSCARSCATCAATQRAAVRRAQPCALTATAEPREESTQSYTPLHR